MFSAPMFGIKFVRYAVSIMDLRHTYLITTFKILYIYIISGNISDIGIFFITVSVSAFALKNPVSVGLYSVLKALLSRSS